MSAHRRSGIGKGLRSLFFLSRRLGEVSCLNDNTLGLMSCRHHVAAEIIEVSREQNLIVPAYRYVGARRTIFNFTADGTLEK